MTKDELIDLIQQHISESEVDMRKVVETAASYPESFALALLDYAGTNGMERFIEEIKDVWWDKGSHK